MLNEAGIKIAGRILNELLLPEAEVVPNPAIWLIASMNPMDEDTLYGLCDLRLGYPELGYVRLSELQCMTVRVPTAGAVGMGLK